MQIVSEKGVSGAVKYLLDIVLAVGAASVAGLPFALKRGFENTIWTSGENYWFLLVFLFGTGLLGLGMVFELRQIFLRINEHNPFQRPNVISLKRIAVLALLISAAYIIKIFFYISFLTIIVAVAFLVFGLAGLVFSELFRQAVDVKEEYDLTI
ncbi:DUF2975 domain-containing protein [Acetonema longum]|uniref:DUF2975 domain-containing protein n=1 Tax=Acetonema longum DSM 6540 TaxID=1009370 RepID=F7NJP7_9FIRM|nr:DUF2975 domain-containing protein [Acetonema longum]EGO63703.1 hypothetical protein ALO_11524 [Acetonema longum DSM 6540]